MSNTAQPDPQKRFVVHEKNDRSKWFSLDPSTAKLWHLESHGSDWDSDGYFRLTTERTLYRLPNKCWVLVEIDSHAEVDLPADPIYEVLTDADASEQLIRSGHVPPDDVIHHVADKLSLPTPAASESASESAASATGPKVRLVDYRRLADVEILTLPHEHEAIGHSYDRGDFAQSFLYRLADGRFVLHSRDFDDSHKEKKAYLLTRDQAFQWMECYSCDIPADVKSLLTKQMIVEKEAALAQANLVDINELDIDEAVRLGARVQDLEEQMATIKTPAELERNAEARGEANGGPPSESTATLPGLDPKRFRRGPDYRDCTWNGERYTFTTTQAACVQVLWEEREKGTLELSQQLLLEKSGAESQQLKDVFKGNTAWNTMVVRGSKSGLYKLADPT